MTLDLASLCFLGEEGHPYHVEGFCIRFLITTLQAERPNFCYKETHLQAQGGYVILHGLYFLGVR